MSTANAVGLGLTLAFGIAMAVLAIVGAQARAFAIVAVVGGGLLAIYWAVGHQLLK